MQKLIIGLYLVIISWSISAQDKAFTDQDSLIFQALESKPTGIVINTSPMFNKMCYTKNWCLSEITLYNDEIIHNKELVYVGFDDSFIWLEPNSYQYIRLERDLIKEVKMKINSKGEYLIFRVMSVKQVIPTISQKVFLNVLVEGKVSLYVYRKIQKYNKSDLKPNFKYILRDQNGEMKVFKPNRISLIAKFPQKKNELRKILKKNKLSIRKESDLKKFIELLNLDIS